VNFSIPLRITYATWLTLPIAKVAEKIIETRVYQTFWWLYFN